MIYNELNTQRLWNRYACIAKAIKLPLAKYSYVRIRKVNILKNCCYHILQGHHFKYKLCRRIPKHFRTKYDVRIHLQDQHSGVAFQCSVWATTQENVPSDNFFNIKKNMFDLKE